MTAQEKEKKSGEASNDRRLETEVTLRRGRGRRRSRVGGENTSSLGRRKEGEKKEVNDSLNHTCTTSPPTALMLLPPPLLPSARLPSLMMLEMLTLTTGTSLCAVGI